jgi:hypothetical protein
VYFAEVDFQNMVFPSNIVDMVDFGIEDTIVLRAWGYINFVVNIGMIQNAFYYGSSCVMPGGQGGHGRFLRRKQFFFVYSLVPWYTSLSPGKEGHSLME